MKRSKSVFTDGVHQFCSKCGQTVNRRAKRELLVEERLYTGAAFECWGCGDHYVGNGGLAPLGEAERREIERVAADFPEAFSRDVFEELSR